MTDPDKILQVLLDTQSIPLETLPMGSGIYALYDHEGQPRYIGITAKCLNDRIFKRHVGGDDNSHKFSSAYNAGRMFHTRKHPDTCLKDGPISKELRRLFVRQYCRAVAIPLPNFSKNELVTIESAVLSRAPPEAKRWNDARTLDAHEPSEALDTFIATLAWSSAKLDAIDRQAWRWRQA